MKYVDPDGLLEYETDLLGKKIKVKISDNIDKKTQETIKKNVDSAIAKINAGKDKLTDTQVKAITSMKGIEVRTNDKRIGMNDGTFQITQRYAENRPDSLSVDFLAGAIIHDSFHADQDRRGKNTLSLDAEKEASAFAADVAQRISLDTKVVDWLKYDVEHGHLAPGVKPPKTRPPKRRTP